MPWLCSICEELLNETKTISITPCGHAFHLECVKKLIIISETCPECRQSVSSSRLVKLHPNEISHKEMLISLYDAHLHKTDERIGRLEGDLKLAISCKTLTIEYCENYTNMWEEINRELKFENEHLNGVKTIVNGTQLEAQKLLSMYSSNAGEKNAAKKLASYCSILKCELDRVISEKKALEFNFQEVKNEYNNKDLKLTQLQKLVENFKKKFSLLETEKRDSSGYDYSRDTSNCGDEQEISMRDYITENDVDYSLITVKFSENQKKIGVRIVEDEMLTTSKLSIFNNEKVVLSSSFTPACQDEAIARIGYDGFGEGPSFINRTFNENLPEHFMGKKRKSTFSRCESPMSDKKK